MTDKARELLEQALIDFECAKEYTGIDYCIVDKIRDFLAQPEEEEIIILTASQIAAEFTEPYLNQWNAFVAGVRFAEKHHGIGGGDE